ncbi:uncharacterized protein LOC120676469 isoform X2 [Panicum virgatum]|uniref:Uncharacterized protein n=1 Tax=Panicum virgatum TaxID=38727 RepID=A0A8T0RSQ5_PANVG|nr:uncharacterized protein LOC120676469 isoform X2 [Panicum virgatum]KAG2587573.1 hypothetical protein PVAP13_5NG433900 [Panicum virgatum]
MPGHLTRGAAHLGGVTSRRHAELLLHSGVGGVSVKDLRLRRVVPPAAGSVGSSPECTAPVKSGSVESTPPEAASAAAAAEDLDRKPVLPRSKLVRDPGSFGYRRLLPFLNEMAKNDSSIDKEVPSDSAAVHSKNELSRSDSRLIDEPLGETRLECDAMDSVEPVVVKTGGDTEVKDGCNNVTEEANTVPHDLASSKPWLARCTRSRFVHHPSSFSYKRMLPFLMENEISSQEGQRVKIRRVAEERLLASDDNGIFASQQQHLAFSDDTSQECSRAQVERMEAEPPKAEKNCFLDDKQHQTAVTKAFPPEYDAAEAQNVLQQEALTSGQDPVTSEGNLISDGDDVQASGQHQIAVSEDSPEECKRDEVKRSVQDEVVKSDGSHVLDSMEFQPAVSEISPSKNEMTDMQKATQEEPSPLDGDEENSDKVDDLANEQLQPCVAKESLTAQLQDNAEFAEVLQCQTKDSRCHDVGFVSPTKTVRPLLHWCCAQDPEDSVASHDDQLLDCDIQMICRSSDPCAIDRSLSVEEMSGCIPLTESGCKAGISQPSGATHSMEKGALSPNKYSPKKLSPKKGILKRHPRGCKGICMCLDCSTFRLHADRAFEFSRKQMQEADDIISNLLKEVANLRSLVEKPAVQTLEKTMSTLL